MRIRQYIPSQDFEVLKSWISDERTHAMWCAFRVQYPLTEEIFNILLAKEKSDYNNTAYIAESDEGRQIGFYCVSLDTIKNESIIKFVVTAPQIRGKGFGTKLISLIKDIEFSLGEVDTVRLCVFDCNKAAIKCYTNAGFRKISCDAQAFRYKDELWGRLHMEAKKIK